MSDRELLAEALEVMLSAINSGDWKVDGACDPHATIVRLTNQISKPEPNPVAWREVAGKTTHYYDYNEQGRGEPLYAAPVHAIDISQERVDETAKDRHEWVGLTDKEVTSIIREWHWMPYELCKVIETKLKEKNCG